MVAHHSRLPAAPLVHSQRCQPFLQRCAVPTHFHISIPTWVSPLGASAFLCPPRLSPETLLFIRTAKRRRHSKSSAHNLRNLSPAPMHCANQVMLCCLAPLAPPHVLCPAPYKCLARPSSITPFRTSHPALPTTPLASSYTPHTSYTRTAATNNTLPYTPPHPLPHTSCTPTEGLATSRPPPRRRHQPDIPPQAAQLEVFPHRGNSAPLYRPGCPWLLPTAELCPSCNCVNSVQAAGIAVRQERQMAPATAAQNKQSGLQHVRPTIMFAAC